MTSEACRVAEGFRPFVTSPVYSCEHDGPGSIIARLLCSIYLQMFSCSKLVK